MKRRLLCLTCIVTLVFSMVFSTGLFSASGADIETPLDILTGGFENFTGDNLNANTYGRVSCYSPLRYDPHNLDAKFAGNSTTDYLYIDNTVSHTGSKSMKMGYPKSSVAGVDYTVFYFYEAIPATELVEGQEYIFSAYIKTDNVETPDASYGNGVSLTLNDTGYNTQSSAITGTADWQRKYIRFVYTAVDFGATLNIRVDARNFAGTIWVDDMTLSSVVAAPPALGYKDGGFEEPGGSLLNNDDGWWMYTGYNGGSPTGIISVDTAQHSEGAQSLKIDHSAQEPNNGTTVWQNHKIVASSVLYRITAKIKTQGVVVNSEFATDPSNGACVRMETRKTGVSSSMRTIIFGTSANTALRGDNDWTTVTAEVTLNSDEEYFTAGPSLSLSTGVMWADDFKIEEIIEVKDTDDKSIVNGGFEGIDNIGDLGDLGFLQTLGAGQTLVLDGVERQSGHQSVKMISTANTEDGMVYQEIKKGLVVGKTYTLSGYLKSDSLVPRDAGDETHGGQLIIQVLDSTGALLRTVHSDVVVGDEGWAKHTLDYEVQEGDAMLRVGFAIRQAMGSVWADNFLFGRMYSPEMPDPTRIVNGDFEELQYVGGSSGVYGYWTYSSAGVKYTGDNPDDHLRIVDDEFHGGGQSCILEHPELNDGIIWQNLSVSAGKYYRAEAWIKTENVVPNNPDEMWHGAQLKMYTVDGSDASMREIIGTVVRGTSGWTKYTLDVLISSDEAKVRPGLALRQSTGKMWIDDFKFYEITEAEFEDPDYKSSEFEPDPDDDLDFGDGFGDDDGTAGEPAPKTGRESALPAVLIILTAASVLLVTLGKKSTVKV